ASWLTSREEMRWMRGVGDRRSQQTPNGSHRIGRVPTNWECGGGRERRARLGNTAAGARLAAPPPNPVPDARYGLTTIRPRIPGWIVHWYGYSPATVKVKLAVSLLVAVRPRSNRAAAVVSVTVWATPPSSLRQVTVPLAARLMVRVSGA